MSSSYARDRVLIGEIWLPDHEQLARYLHPDELHSVFNFDFLCCAWEAPAPRGVIDATLDSHARVDATPTWVLSNHDVVRHVTRYGRAETAFSMSDRRIGVPSDLQLGTRRAGAAALLTFSLPGGVYLYQGDELGLPEVEDLPDELHRRALRLRPAEAALADSTLTWLPAPEGVLSYHRGGALTVVANLSARPVELPAHGELLIASGELRDGLLPPDTAVWLRD